MKRSREKGNQAEGTAARGRGRGGKSSVKASEPRREVDHSVALVFSIYRTQMEQLGGKGDNLLTASVAPFMRDLADRTVSRDAIEELLLAQMIVTHGRLMYLTSQASFQTNIKWATMMHEAADRAANTFRRQMLALAEYRRPPRRGDSFTAIAQANIAQQQVVQQNPGNSQHGKSTNEQGFAAGRAPTPAPAQLPADTRGTGIPSGISPPREAVAAEHGTGHGDRQEAVENECP